MNACKPAVPAPDGQALRFSANTGAVREAIIVTLARLAQGGHSADELVQLELVLAEILNNIVEHGYAGRDDGEIELTIRQKHPLIAGQIRDWGREMPGGALPAARLPEIGNRIEDLPEGGFGWYIVHSLTRDLSYQRLDGCNMLSFSVKLGEYGPA